MKKLNITKEQFNRSRYFKNKYGKLEYVSESGKLFKTSKGKVLKFNESGGNDESSIIADMNAVRKYRKQLQKCADEIHELSYYGFVVSSLSASKREGTFGSMRIGKYYFFGYRLMNGSTLFYDPDNDQFNKKSDDAFIDEIMNDESGELTGLIHKMSTDVLDYIK